jgi:hypothetical protein
MAACSVLLHEGGKHFFVSVVFEQRCHSILGEKGAQAWE